MCRSIVRFFLVVLFLIIGILFALLLNIRFRLLESAYYKNFLKDNDAYTVAVKAGTDYFLKSNTDQKGVLLIQPVYDTILKDFVTPELIQEVTERNMDNIFNFLHGREDRLYLYFPKEELLEALTIEKIDELETQTNALIKSLPTCTEEQLGQFEGEIGPMSRVECLPPTFQGPTQDFSQILSDISAYTGHNALEGIFEEGGLLPGFSEQMDFAKLIGSGPREPGSPDPEALFVNAQSGFRYFNIGLIVTGFFLVLLIAFYVLLGDLKDTLKSIGTILILLGVPLTLIGALFTFPLELGKELFIKYVLPRIGIEIISSLTFLPDLVVKFVSGAFLPILVAGLILIILGVTLILINKLINSKKADMDVKPETKPKDK